jgi:hypothetical protein
MSHITSTAIPVKTISIQELRQLLASKRPIEFWHVLTDGWFKGENISGSRHAPLDKVGTEAEHESAQGDGDRRILRRPEMSAEPHGGGEVDEAWP